MRRFSAGIAARDITPPREELEECRAGSFSTDSPFPRGAAHPLWAKALATRDGDRTLLLFSADLLYTPRWLSDEVRGRLGRELGLPREAIALCTSQTHSSFPVLTRQVSYSRRLIDALVELGAAAVADLRPARIGAARTWLPSLCYNSDLNITPQTPTSICPDPQRHAGGCMFVRDHVVGRSTGLPVDHEVGVIRIDDPQGRPRAVLFQYNCHPATVIEGPQMHGDYAGFAAEIIERSLPGTAALFLQGSLGNSHPRWFFTNIDRARENGSELADEVLRVLPDIVTTESVTMGFAGEDFPVTLVPYPTERLERLRGYFNEFLRELAVHPDASWIGAGPDTVNLPPKFTVEARRNMVTPLVRYCEDRLARRRRGEPDQLDPLPTDIQVFRWNDIALCLHGLEMYFQTGLEIKRLSPLRYTFPVGNSNTVAGYVAPPDQFEFGGYPVVTNPMYAGLGGMRSPQNHARIINRFQHLLRGRLGSGPE